MVNTSTGGAIYGETTVVPTPETEPTIPLSPYGLSKRTAEQYADWYRRMKGLDVGALRYGNVYGPRQDPFGDAGVVAILCSRLLEGRPPMVFGDGLQTRDYVYVDDIVAASVTAAHARDLRHEVYNLGTEREISIVELIEAASMAVGRDPATFAPFWLSPPPSGTTAPPACRSQDPGSPTTTDLVRTCSSSPTSS